MPTTKKLLSITNLKKYFPVAKSSIFQRRKLYVRANENITIDIYEGETLGIVGESGCGKSTLGRVLLQLYPQTSGCTLYYGKTLDEMTPFYMYQTIKYGKVYRKRLAKAQAKARMLEQKVEEAGGEDHADAYLLQECSFAKADEQGHLSNLAKILGGFFVREDPEGKRFALDGLETENDAFPAGANPADSLEAWETGEIRDGVFVPDMVFRRSFRYPSLTLSLKEDPAKIRAVMTTDAAGNRRAFARPEEAGED